MIQLSEAMDLGSFLLTPIHGNTKVGNQGCAIGMAALAVGMLSDDGCFTAPPPKEWQWLERSVAMLPCLCSQDLNVMGRNAVIVDRRVVLSSFQNVIMHLFNQHVCATQTDTSRGIEKWSMRQLIDYVRSVEPAEVTPSCAELAATCTDGRERGGQMKLIQNILAFALLTGLWAIIFLPWVLR